MAHQITVLNSSDNSFVKAFFVSQPLYQKLVRISQIFELKHLNLAFLQEIRLRGAEGGAAPLSRLAAVCPIRGCTYCSRHLKSIQPDKVFALASQSLIWFDELFALIKAVEQLTEPLSLSIML